LPPSQPEKWGGQHDDEEDPSLQPRTGNSIQAQCSRGPSREQKTGRPLRVIRVESVGGPWFPLLHHGKAPVSRTNFDVGSLKEESRG